jgi:hypothetical protein
MGADMADVNNDGKADIFVTDMLPESDERLKNTTNFENYDLFLRKINLDFSINTCKTPYRLIME